MSERKVKPLDVVKALVRLQAFDEDCGDVITNLKAQKLLYYAQGLHYAKTGRPLFEEDFEAWQYGPVIPGLYDELKQFGKNQLHFDEDFDDSVFTDEQLDVIVRTYKTFGQYSAWKLRDMTHEEAPWRNAKLRGVISKVSIRDYFTERFAGSF